MPEPKLAKQALEDVLTKAMVNEIWAVNFSELIPFTLQHFSVGSVLPTAMYMFRRGYRRGAGNFHRAFAPLDGEVVGKKRAGGREPEPSVTSVARVLASDAEHFDGFTAKTGRDILADLLLCHCLENQQHEPGRHQPLIRAFPTHYLSSWMDLPRKVVHLRDVPESLVSILAEQKQGDDLVIDDCQESWFRVGSDFEHNLLLKVLGHGMQLGKQAANLHEDFLETAAVGVDQLLTIRVAQKCGAAPQKLKESSRLSKGSGIPNRHPVARPAARAWSQDFRIILQAYGEMIPRQCLLPMLESCIGLGITNVFLSTARMLFDWEKTGALPHAQPPTALFVDSSAGSDRSLRSIAEESLEECERRLRRLPVILMALRILEYRARQQLGKSLPPSRPDATDRINRLGDLIQMRHEKSQHLFDALSESCNAILEQLEDTTGLDDAIAVLSSDEAIPHPAWRIAEAVTLMMGEKTQNEAVIKCLKSCMMIDESNGLAVERRVRFSTIRKGKMSGTVRSIVLTNTMLDFLVHRHLRKPGKKGRTQPHPLSFSEFLRILREQYGLCIDQAPPGQSISVELLLRNRRILESRLRDLGLLIGVNDAESMKRLRPRFPARELEVAHDDK